MLPPRTPATVSAGDGMIIVMICISVAYIFVSLYLWKYRKVDLCVVISGLSLGIGFHTQSSIDSNCLMVENNCLWVVVFWCGACFFITAIS